MKIYKLKIYKSKIYKSKIYKSGQSVIGMTIIVSIAAAFTAAIYQQSHIRTHDQALRQMEIGIARTAFETAAKRLRYIYQNNGACDPQAFAQAVASLPNPTSMANSLSAQQNCDTVIGGSCRALEIISPNEAGYLDSLYVYVGAVTYSRVDSCVVPGAAVNDLDAANGNCALGTRSSIPQGAVGAHLRTVINNVRYEQWVVLLDTCSTQNVQRITTTALAAGAGTGMGTGWQLGSSHIAPDPNPPNQVVGVDNNSLTCPYGGGAPNVANNMGRVNLDPTGTAEWRFSLLALRRNFSLLQAPFDPSIDFPNPECLDLNQDGVIDERDLNVLEKYLSGWLPHIPVREQ